MKATVIRGEKSDFKSVSAGVQQGSVLGPLLFLIYINDVVKNIDSVIKLFAGDTSLSLALNNPDSRAEIRKHDLEKLMNGPKNGKLDLTKKNNNNRKQKKTNKQNQKTKLNN